MIAAIAWLAISVNARFLGGGDWHWVLWLAGIGVVAFTIGRWLAAQIFGWNLLLTCRYFGINHNDAFSAMKLDSHRHFLRIRILGDTLTVYPVKLEKAPARSAWKLNPDRPANAAASVFVADPPLTPELVEAPISIDARQAPSTEDVKKPGELPPKG